MNRLLMVVALVIGMSGALSCSEPYVGCVDNGDCGEGQACIVNVCEAVECFESKDCALQQKCDLATYSCVSGCDVDSDCMAGESCNAGECEPYGCRDTQLDCFIGEVCNLNTGTCDPAEGDHCKPCSGTGGQCGATAACYTFEGSQNYCLEECQTTDDCPRGYTCGADSEGQLICVGACPLYDEMGLLSW
jgi:hypothetical protein